jgi:hypothetical protein
MPAALADTNVALLISGQLGKCRGSSIFFIQAVNIGNIKICKTATRFNC